MIDLHGKVAVVTGASRGIGKAIALKYAQAGADIAILYVGEQEAEAAAVCQEAEALGVQAKSYLCDVTDFARTKEVTESVIADLGGIDILVNNAGITRDKLLLQMSEADFDQVMDVNLKGAFNMIRHVYSHMMKKRQGCIINIASVAGVMGNAGQANYASSKAGLIGLTKTVAKELGSRNVTCNAIAPGMIATDMTQVLPEKVKEAMIAGIPMKRPGSPEDVANVALFLASDLASYVTGEVIKVDGGMVM